MTATDVDLEFRRWRLMDLAETFEDLDQVEVDGALALNAHPSLGYSARETAFAALVHAAQALEDRDSDGSHYTVDGSPMDPDSLRTLRLQDVADALGYLLHGDQLKAAS